MFIKSTALGVISMGSMDAKEIKWLNPGWNDFPNRIWEQNKDSPLIKRYLAEGVLSIFNEKVTSMVGKKKVKTDIGMATTRLKLSDLPEALAIKVVKESYERSMLTRWLNVETRPKVKKYLETQLAPPDGKKPPMPAPCAPVREIDEFAEQAL